MKIYFKIILDYLWIIILLTGCRSMWQQPIPNAEIMYQTGSFEQYVVVGFSTSPNLRPLLS